MSQAKASLAPSTSAAMDRIPLPQPRSSTLSPPWMYLSSDCRHSRVVAWLPVPKVRPGFSTSFIRPLALVSSHWGTTSSRSPISMGL